MRPFLHFAFSACALFNASIARANFIIETRQPIPSGANLTQPGAVGMPQPLAPANVHGPVHWKMATGFGINVPLAFACRQIVPPAVKVIYGPGVNPATLVIWRGGDTWNHVLRDAVKPLGLHLEMTYMAVAIEKNASD